MTYAREPVLQPVPIESLRPTQITVGMREVEEKRKRLRKQKPRKVGSFIGRHMIPVVLGPKKRHYVIDHLIPLEVGGSNDITNLWPQRKGDAEQKDKLENELHARVCDGAIDVSTAQRSHHHRNRKARASGCEILQSQTTLAHRCPATRR